jgi:hypothetical protein
MGAPPQPQLAANLLSSCPLFTGITKSMTTGMGTPYPSLLALNPTFFSKVRSYA